MPTNAGNKAFEEGESKKRLSIKRMDCKYRVKGEAIAKFASLPAKKSAKAYAVIALQAAKKAGAVTGKGLKTAGAAASRACKPIGIRLRIMWFCAMRAKCETSLKRCTRALAWP